MKTAKEITKRSTLLATIRSEFPKSTAIDLENELFDMINKALMLGGVVGRSEQLLFSPDDIERIIDEKSQFSGMQFRRYFEEK